MPQVKKHNSDADRQAAYRRRCAQSHVLLAATDLPAPTRLAALPSTGRWRKGIVQAHNLLELVQQEMQAYYDQRSDNWQDGDKGDAFQERLEAIGEAIAQVDELLT
jgi:hypothetical protein